jgi:cytochrome P450
MVHISSHHLRESYILFRAILRDERVYPEPESFKPERFMSSDGQLDPLVPHPNIAAFGFGRFVYF